TSRRLRGDRVCEETTDLSAEARRMSAEPTSGGDRPADRLGRDEGPSASDATETAGTSEGARISSSSSLDPRLPAGGPGLELVPAALAGRSPEPGDRLGRFELLQELGRGGFGIVFEARDTELGRKVALKVVRVREGSSGRSLARFIQLFRREAETAARLSHPNIVTLFDFGSWQELPYLVFELVEGETLEHRLRRGPLPAAEAVPVPTPVAPQIG